MQLRKKNVWVFHYEKGGDTSDPDTHIFYYKTAARMIKECMKHITLHNISLTEISFGMIIMIEEEPKIARLSFEMIREAQEAARRKH
jgi:hypothetical protein